VGKAPLPLHGLVTRISAKWPKTKLPPRTDQLELDDLDAFNRAQELFKRTMDTIIENTWTDADHLPDHDKEQVRRFYNKMLAKNGVGEEEIVGEEMVGEQEMVAEKEMVGEEMVGKEEMVDKEDMLGEEETVDKEEMIDEAMWDILIRDSEDNGGAVM
jgi:hypothetical protein